MHKARFVCYVNVLTALLALHFSRDSKGFREESFFLHNFAPTSKESLFLVWQGSEEPKVDIPMGKIREQGYCKNIELR